MPIKENYIVKKRNILNELRSNAMSLQELRFFSIYLAKINSNDPTTRVVTFPLEDFRKIMELGRMNLSHTMTATTKLLQKVVNVINPDGGYSAFQLFKRCKIYKNELDQWYVEIDAHDDALPLMFSFKKEYFSYKLWNALSLKSKNQLRMYEILKQYQNAGERKLSLTSLRELLGLASDEYPRWDNFKARVLDSCQQALQENTDICFTYEPIKVGRKFTGVHFYIQENPKYVDKISLSEFIDLQPSISGDEWDRLEFLAEACNCEFDRDQMNEIYQILVTIPDDKLPLVDGDIEFQRYHYLAQKYATLCSRDRPNRPINHRYNYFLQLLRADAGL